MLRWAGVILTLMAGPVFAAECQSTTDTISGRLGLFETQHPNGDQISGWILLTNRICVHMENFDGDMVDIEPHVVHVVFADGAEPADLMQLSSDVVAIRGDLVEAHTLWHLGDVVMFDAVIVPY